MSSEICFEDQSFCVSNKTLVLLVELVVEAGRDTQSTPAEKEYVDRLDHWIQEEYWSGLDLDLNEEFPTVDEKKFWAKCFFDLGRKIYLREIGDHTIDFWQAAITGVAFVTGRMLCDAVRKQSGQSWSPETEDGKSFRAYYYGPNRQD